MSIRCIFGSNSIVNSKKEEKETRRKEKRKDEKVAVGKALIIRDVERQALLRMLSETQHPNILNI